MAESTEPRPARIAFAFSDDARADAAHVRDALAAQLPIVYEAPAGSFDVRRALAERVEAVLVNVDGGEWMEAFEAKLTAANLRAVFNDPETSGQLEGAEHARWLRHLVAKLRGSDNVDPPRPPSAMQPRAPALAPAKVVAEARKPHKPVAPAVARTPAPPAAAPVAPSPRQPRVAATATPPPAPVALPATPPPAPVAPPAFAADDFGNLELENTAAAPLDLQALSAQIDARLSGHAVPPETATDAAADTDALSSLIDARLAEPARAPPAEADTLWDAPPTSGRASFDPAPAGGKRAPAMPPPAPLPARPQPAIAKPAVAKPPAAAKPAARVAKPASAADAPPMDQWALVDHDATLLHDPPPRPRKPAPPTAPPRPSAAAADLTLLPIEAQTPVATGAAPVERWLDKSKGGSKKDGHRP